MIKKEDQEIYILNSEDYKKIIENTSDLIALVSFSIKPVYLYISPSHKRIFDYLPEDLVGKASLDFLHPDDKQELFLLLKQHIGAKAKKLLFGNSLESNKKIEYRFRDKKVIGIIWKARLIFWAINCCLFPRMLPSGSE